MTAKVAQIAPSELLSAVLDDLSAGVLLTAHDGHVIYLNAAAKRLVRSGRALRLANNRLRPTDAATAHHFTTALARTVEGAGSALRQSVTLALPDCRGAGMVATLLPLRHRDTAQAALAAIFIQDPSALPPFPGEAFAKLYGLTNAELRVVLAMRREATTQRMAAILGIGLETVRTHLKHIFQKTGTSRQADLMALMSRASALTEVGLGHLLGPDVGIAEQR